MLVGIDQIEGLSAALANAGGAGGMPGSKVVWTSVNGVTITAGRQLDSSGSVDIVIPNPLPKSLLAWQVGAGGGRDTGAAALASTGVHVFAIRNPATGASDALFSTSPVNPVLPAGFTQFRRLGAITLDAAGNFRNFRQHGRKFKLVNAVTDFSNQANGGGPFLRKISVPQGRKMIASIFFHSTGNTDSTYHSGLYDPDMGLPPPFGTPQQFAQIVRRPLMITGGVLNSYERMMTTVDTDSNAQIYTWTNDGGDLIVIRVLGWEDNIDELA